MVINLRVFGIDPNARCWWGKIRRIYRL